MNYFIHMLLYLLRCEEYFSVIICTFYIIDCVQGLEFFHCNFYIIGLEKNHFGPKSILLCTNRKWGFLQCNTTYLVQKISLGEIMENIKFLDTMVHKEDIKKVSLEVEDNTAKSLISCLYKVALTLVQSDFFSSPVM